MSKTLVKPRDADVETESMADSAAAYSAVDDGLNEQRRLVYLQTPTGIIVNLLAAIGTGLLVWPSDPSYLVFPWLLFLSLTSCLQIYAHYSYRERITQPWAPRAWHATNRFLVICIGAGWGVGATLLIPHLSGTEAAALLAVSACVAMAGLVVLGPLPATSALYAGAILGPVVAWSLWSPDVAFAPIVSVVALGLTALMVLLGRSHAAAVSGLSARAAELTAERSDLAGVNRELDADRRGLEVELKSAEKALARLFEDKERARVTLHALSEGVITTEVNGIVDYLNPVAEVLTGWAQADIRGRPVMNVFPIIDSNSRDPIDNPVERCLRTEAGVVGTDSTVLVRRDGLEYEIEYSASPIHDREGHFTGAVLIFRDVTEKRAMAKRLSWQATHDALTGLINRTEFESRLEKVLGAERAQGRSHALCFIDLDHFKLVNDTHGHVAGDELLRKLAQTLRTRVRGSDTLARLGGDEFGVLLYSCSLGKARLIADGLRQMVEEFSYEWEGNTLRVGASIGVIEITESLSDLTSVLRAADVACYIAKDHGRNRVHVFQPDDAVVAQRHGEMRWVQSVQRSLAQDSFRLYYQPIWSLSDEGAECNCEILMRMIDDDGTVVSPREFLAAAERYHLLPSIDRWVVKAAFDALLLRHPALVSMNRISINVSGQSICDDRFLTYVLDLLEGSTLPANKICFEIAESSLVSNMQHAQRFIEVLKEHGCRFALDDFGSGVSCFNYLKTLPVDYLKIDGCFVRNITSNAIDYALVDAINQLAHVVGIHTVAENVTDEATLELLRKVGVDYAQGFVIDMPRPLESTVETIS